MGKVAAKARRGSEEKTKKKVIKEGEVQLLRELTAGDWAWLRRRVERRGCVRMDSVVVEEDDDDDGEDDEEDSPEEEDDWAVREYKALYCVGKRKWDQVLTLLKADQDGENEDEDEEGSEEEEVEHHEEREYKRRKLNRLEEEEEFLAADPITNLNPILDRCHITNN